MTLAEIIASGRATVKLEDVVRVRAGEDSVLDLARCSAYEIAASGGLPFVLRVGRRYLVSVPGLLRFLQVPLPDDWQPSATLAPRCQCPDAGSASTPTMTSGPKVGATDSPCQDANCVPLRPGSDLAAGVRSMRG